MECPRCQHENPPTMKFCGECGTPITTAPSGSPALSYSEITTALSETLEPQVATSEILQSRGRELAEAQAQRSAMRESCASSRARRRISRP